jgi:hypothetical protein
MFGFPSQPQAFWSGALRRPLGTQPGTAAAPAASFAAAPTYRYHRTFTASISLAGGSALPKFWNKEENVRFAQTNFQCKRPWRASFCSKHSD